MKIKWWEKTIEYFFVKKYVKNDFIVPLDGNEEQAGDAIFSNKNKWILIEFKKDEKSISSEKDKFTNYEKAKLELSSCDSHHFIIFGYEKENTLCVTSQTYFSGKKYTIHKALSEGINVDEFKNYLEKFLQYKKGSIIDGGDGSYGLIAGISVDGEISKCLTIQEFKESFNMDITQKQQPAQQIYRMR